MLPLSEDLNANWRFEYKYRLTYHQYYRIRSAILPYMKKDGYSLATPGGRYFVRSLYFDSDDFRNYEEKINGDSERIKLRIRTYKSSSEKDDDLRVELKARKGITMEKHSTWIKNAFYHEFMKTRHWPISHDAILEEFERYLHLKTLWPKIIVEYEREGFTSRGMENIRVTFDHKVRSTRAASLYPDYPLFRPHHPGLIVLEIKCNKTQPGWLRPLVQQQGLCLITNSKFAQGIEIARPELVRSSWSN